MQTHPTLARLGVLSGFATSALTTAAFAAALFAIPISGANCPGDCASYPFLDTLGQYPRDFVWMPIAMGAVLAHLVLITAVHRATPADRQPLSQVALVIASVASGVLLVDYYLQLTVIPASLMHDHTDGLPLLIQYNPRGVFLALEELGYLLMGGAFLFLGLALPRAPRPLAAARLLLLGASGLTLATLVGFPLTWGHDRLDRMEVALISIVWLTWIGLGGLLGLGFRRAPSRAP